MKVCEHHKLDLTRASTKNIGVIICVDCENEERLEINDKEFSIEKE